MKSSRTAHFCLSLLIIVGFFFLFAPTYFYYSTALIRLVFSRGQYFWGVFFIILSFIYRRNRISSVEILMYIYYIVIIISTALNHNPFLVPVKEMITIMGTVSLVLFAAERYPKTLYVGIYDILLIYSFLNIVTVLLFPQGMYENRSVSYLLRNWLLGYDNQHINYLLPLICLGLIRDQKYGKSYYGIIAYLISIATIIMTQSVASLIVLAIMFIPVFLKSFYNNRLLKLDLILYVTFAMEIVMIVLGNISFLVPVINFFGKSTTLSGRLKIWQLTSMRIMQKPVLGWGLMTYDRRLSYFSSSPIAALHAHNRIMEVTYMGGIVLLVIYIIMLITCSSELKKMNNNYISFVLTITIAAYLVGMLTEYYGSARMFFPILALCSEPFLEIPILETGKAIVLTDGRLFIRRKKRRHKGWN